jgi:hypothetical protein
MADDSKPDPKNDDAAEAEKAYWDRNKSELRGVLDQWFDDKVKEAKASTSRNGGRSTLPGILANLVFGPADK